MYIKGRYIVSTCALLFFQQALASGMDCTKAASVVEKAICADKPLYELDARMGAAYRKLMKAAPAQAEVKKAQRQWLKERDRCGEEVSCLSQRYQDRLQVLHAQWIDAVAYKPDEIDKQVMEDLQQRIREMSKENPEFALERALNSMTLGYVGSSFSAELDEDEQPLFPTTIPKEVTQDEWKALQASDIKGAAESGQTSYTLMDLDGDGQRDLIVETYAGGTGMFHYTETWRRSDSRFIRRTAEFSSQNSNDSVLFYTNDRGANQSAYLIGTHGKIYFAYQNGSYGEDQVYLLNPLKINRQVPTVSVRYDYQLTVPHTQYIEDSDKAYELEPSLQKVLAKAVTGLDANAGMTGQQKKPLCPIPQSAKDIEEYYGYGASYYAVEPVADFPVIIGDDCYVARLINWFGTYDEKNGLPALLLMRKPESEDPQRSYSVNGRRHITQVSTSVGKTKGGAESL
ncbi:lysozyme inhibitor LprI family protein [Pseudomonas sp. RIT778]|uniref:lysozyme inhibitor LprI family protein n=1 Tax=Pseudomonas sp. RIT778 TaxID=2870471 RepID=UPI001C8773FC|nr:lysozyme inhibitor LprI family protein [Pseudomonas sp. RIT778]MBX8469437.1 lysozyme inhibitor LprI family protein [Pseudomonas sp. RIT778]